MNAMRMGFGLVVIAVVASPIHIAGRQQAGPPTTAAAEVTQCSQAQMVVDQLLATAMTRLEAARQTNAAADLRAAVDSLQTTLRDARAQLAPCASMQPSAGAPMDHSKMPIGTTPAAKPSPGAKPPAAAPVDHSKMPMAG